MHKHKITATAGDQSVILTVELAEENSAVGSMDITTTLEIPVDVAESLQRQLGRAIGASRRQNTPAPLNPPILALDALASN